MMKEIENFEFDNNSLIKGVLLITNEVRSDFSIHDVEDQLQFIVESAKESIMNELDIKKKIFVLMRFFYQDLLFSSVKIVYSLSDSFWIDRVLLNRQGAPVLLGLIILHIANILNLPIVPLFLYSQLILYVQFINGDNLYINPINGEILTEKTIKFWINNFINPIVFFKKKNLKEIKNKILIKKIFDTLKAILIEERKMEQALKICEALLLLYPNDPYEIRDRGLIFSHLDCYKVAISDLSYFIKECPNDPVSEMVKMQIHLIEEQEQKDIIFH